MRELWAAWAAWAHRTGLISQLRKGTRAIDQRHKVSGNYLYELPFGKDKRWVTTGAGSHILEGFSVSGSFTFASGTPLTPVLRAAQTSVACGTGGNVSAESYGNATQFEYGAAVV